MKKVLKIVLTAALSCVILAAAFGCGDASFVNRDGKYRCHEEGSYYFIVIKDKTATMYLSESDDFTTAEKLINGDYTVTESTDESITLKNKTLLISTTYAITVSENGRVSLRNDDKNRTFEKIGA